MGKAIGGLPEAAPLGPEGGAEESFALGSWLARQRELRGISREELSALTRLPLRSLERLEGGAYDGQQDGFVRGFVRTVALAIGLDPVDAVARLLAEPAARPRRRALDPRRVALAGLALALLIGGVAALRDWANAPPAPGAVTAHAPIRRLDPVRALAIEQGLLSEDGDEAAGALPFAPAPRATGDGEAPEETAAAPAPASD
jgi:Helix-turn-helix domain